MLIAIDCYKSTSRNGHQLAVSGGESRDESEFERGWYPSDREPTADRWPRHDHRGLGTVVLASDRCVLIVRTRARRDGTFGVHDFSRFGRVPTVLLAPEEIRLPETGEIVPLCVCIVDIQLIFGLGSTESKSSLLQNGGHRYRTGTCATQALDAGRSRSGLHRYACNLERRTPAKATGLDERRGES